MRNYILCTPVNPNGLGWVNVSGAPVNGFDWSYRNDGNGTFYVYYGIDREDDRVINWEPSDLETQALIPDPNDHLACAEFALALIDRNMSP